MIRGVDCVQYSVAHVECTKFAKRVEVAKRADCVEIKELAKSTEFIEYGDCVECANRLKCAKVLSMRTNL